MPFSQMREFRQSSCLDSRPPPHPTFCPRAITTARTSTCRVLLLSIVAAFPGAPPNGRLLLLAVVMRKKKTNLKSWTCHTSLQTYLTAPSLTFPTPNLLTSRPIPRKKSHPLQLLVLTRLRALLPHERNATRHRLPLTRCVVCSLTTILTPLLRVFPTGVHHLIPHRPEICLPAPFAILPACW